MFRRLQHPRSILVSLALAAVATASLTHCHEARGDAPAAEPASAPAKISYNQDIRPIFNSHCIACHGGVKAAGGISFLFREEALTVGDSGKAAIVPGQPDESYLLQRVASTNPDEVMPPSDHGAPLAAGEVSKIRQWIAEGAPWEDHWAYIAPVQPAVPAPVDPAWVKNPIDAFVLSRLEAEGLQPNPVADPAVLIRRMSLDLTGLPPTEPERADFLAAWAQDPDTAVAAAADRLLASPSFGERWAAMWMDLARYADTKGYEKDNQRNSWPYRDFLIRSFDADKPYTEFITQQVAGDLLPRDNADNLVATLFSRLTQINEEGGTSDEEFRVSAVIDRVNTTWASILGTSFACVQCHSHPYDPIRHEEYFKFYSFFNNTEDNDDLDYPGLRLPADPALAAQSLDWQRQIPALRLERDRPAIDLAAQSSWQDVAFGKVYLSTDTITLTPQQIGGHTTLVQGGTVPAGSSYWIDFTPAEATVSAIRVVSPVLDDKVGQANVGFTVSQITLEKIDANGAHSPLGLSLATTDANRIDHDITRVLDGDPPGWSQYPMQFRDAAVLLTLTQPVTLGPGEALRLGFIHRTSNERTDTHIKRLRFETTADPRWTAAPQDPARVAAQQQIDRLQAQVNAAGGLEPLPVLLERPSGNRRGTFVFVKGNWMTAGEEVGPAVPEMLNDLAPRDAGAGPDRLDLAHWMVARDNPLTARVLVNRLWNELFGRGIVSSLGDFGSQADKPSNQALLDWLAVRFMDDHGWRIKPLLRDFVTSATYRQSAVADAAAHQRDPFNEQLARGPRTRLTAEMVRDQALAVSGLLSAKKFGPSVMPFQPDGVWQTVYSGMKWETPQGEDAHRRALYTFWRRTSPYPSMITFDAPSREFCVTERIATNTPLHALTTLNDPVYIECARALAQAHPPADWNQPEARDLAIGAIYLRCSGLPIDPDTLTELRSLLDDALIDFRAHPDQATAFGPGPELAALTTVASVILNLDEVITK